VSGVITSEAGIAFRGKNNSAHTDKTDKARTNTEAKPKYDAVILFTSRRFSVFVRALSVLSV